MCTFVHVCDFDVAKRTCRISVSVLCVRIRVTVTRDDCACVTFVTGE